MRWLFIIAALGFAGCAATATGSAPRLILTCDGATVFETELRAGAMALIVPQCKELNAEVRK